MTKCKSEQQSLEMFVASMRPLKRDMIGDIITDLKVLQVIQIQKPWLIWTFMELLAKDVKEQDYFIYCLVLDCYF